MPQQFREVQNRRPAPWGPFLSKHNIISILGGRLGTSLLWDLLHPTGHMANPGHAMITVGVNHEFIQPPTIDKPALVPPRLFWALNGVL